MKRILLVLAVVSLVFTGVVSASVQQGETELDLAGSFQSQNLSDEAGGGTDNFFTVMTRLGYFITDNIRVGGTASGTWTEGPDTYSLGAFAAYNFMPSNQLVPYVGGQIGYTWLTGDDEDSNGFMYGPLVGVRYELNPTNDLFVEYQFQLFSGDLGDNLDNVHAVFFGIQHIFKK